MEDNLKSALAVIECQIRALTLAKCDPLVIGELKRIVSFERRKAGIQKSRPSLSTDETKENKNSYHDITLEDVGTMIEAGADRHELESILIQRFNFTRGSVKSISSKDGLIAAIRTEMRNEKAHNAISNLTKS